MKTEKAILNVTKKQYTPEQALELVAGILKPFAHPNPPPLEQAHLKMYEMPSTGIMVTQDEQDQGKLKFHFFPIHQPVTATADKLRVIGIGLHLPSLNDDSIEYMRKWLALLDNLLHRARQTVH